MFNKLSRSRRVFGSLLVSIVSIVSIILYPCSILLYIIIFIYKKNKYTKYLVLVLLFLYKKTKEKTNKLST